MDKSKLKEIIREIVDKVLAENAPAPAKPAPGKETETPVKQPDKPKQPRRGLDPEDPSILPNVKPKAKKKQTMNEEEMLNKIVARFKSKK